MKVSQNNQRLQKTKYLGSSAENKVELLKISKECIEDFRQLQIEKSVNLNIESLERILSKENLLLAMKRVVIISIN